MDLEAGNKITSISSYEQACARAEQAATSAMHAAKQLARVAALMITASRDGDAGTLRKSTEQVRRAAAEIVTTAQLAVSAWNYSDDTLTTYLSNAYQSELVEAGAVENVRIDVLDNRLAAFPVVIQLLPSQRAVRLDGKRTTLLRPKRLVEQIRRRQQVGGVKPDRFIEVLFSAYKRLDQNLGVQLIDIYELLTPLPEVRSSYSPADFARDIYILEQSNTTKTKSRANK